MSAIDPGADIAKSKLAFLKLSFNRAELKVWNWAVSGLSGVGQKAPKTAGQLKNQTQLPRLTSTQWLQMSPIRRVRFSIPA